MTEKTDSNPLTGTEEAGHFSLDALMRSLAMGFTQICPLGSQIKDLTGTPVTFEQAQAHGFKFGDLSRDFGKLSAGFVIEDGFNAKDDDAPFPLQGTAPYRWLDTNDDENVVVYNLAKLCFIQSGDLGSRQYEVDKDGVFQRTAEAVSRGDGWIVKGIGLPAGFLNAPEGTSHVTDDQSWAFLGIVERNRCGTELSDQPLMAANADVRKAQALLRKAKAVSNPEWAANPKNDQDSALSAF